jgi:hypothetical protein
MPTGGRSRDQPGWRGAAGHYVKPSWEITYAVKAPIPGPAGHGDVLGAGGVLLQPLKYGGTPSQHERWRRYYAEEMALARYRQRQVSTTCGPDYRRPARPCCRVPCCHGAW